MPRLLLCLTLLCLAAGAQSQPPSECLTPQGMQSGVIKDSSLVVSSEAVGKPKEDARYGCCQTECGAAWCPRDNDTNPYYEVHLDTPTSVSAIEFQHPTWGIPTCKTFAQDFMLTFRLKFKPVFGTDQLVEFNHNITAIHNESAAYRMQFIPSFVTQIVRIEPQDYRNKACFKFEVLGCEPAALCPKDFCKNNGRCMGSNLCECGQGFFGATCELQAVDIQQTSYSLLFTKIEQHVLKTTEFSMSVSGSVQLEEVSGQKVIVLGEGGAAQINTTGHSDLCLQDIDQCSAGFTYSLTLNIEKITSGQIQFLSNGNEYKQKGVWLFYEDNVFTCKVGTSTQFWSLHVSHTLTVGSWYKLSVSWNRVLGLQLLLDNQVLGSKVQAQQRPVSSYTSEPLTIGHQSNKGIIYRLFQLQLVPLVASEILRANVTETKPPSLPTGENMTACKVPLGMENGDISSSQIVVSSSAIGHDKDDVRFGLVHGIAGKSWCPRETNNSFLEVHFHKSIAIGGLHFQLPQTSGSKPLDSYMKTFRLMFKNDVVDHSSVGFTEFSKNVPATEGSKTAMTITLSPIIITSVIRFEPETWVGSPCFRLELLGCDPAGLCEAGFCKNKGTCIAENFCQCPDGYYGNDCSKTGVTVTTFTFLSITENMVITRSENLTFHGDIKLDSMTSQLTLSNAAYFTMSRPGQCLTDLDMCASGFTFSLTINFLQLTDEKFYLLTSGGDQNGYKGIALLYQENHLHCYVSTSSRRWVLSVPYLLMTSHWYRFHISWNPSLGLNLFERDNLLGTAYITQAMKATKVEHVSVGNQLHVTKTLKMVVQEFQTVNQIFHEVKRSGVTEAPLPSPLPVAATPQTPAATPGVTPTAAHSYLCETVLGVGEGEITEDHITVSSYSADHGKQKLRHDCCTGEELGGWCAHSNDTDPWVEISLPTARAISNIVFQPPASPDNKPASYVTIVDIYFNNLLSPSNNLELYAKHVEAVVNGTSNTVSLRPEIVTDKVRVSITSSVGESCMRLELVGCDQKDLCSTDACSHGGSCAGVDACKCDENHYGNGCQYTKTDVPQFEFTILEKIENIIRTSYLNLTVHNTVMVQTHLAQSVLVLGNQGYVEVPLTHPCIHNLDKCSSGFTYSIRINFRTLGEEIPLLSSGNGKTGLSLTYINDVIHCSVGTQTSVWRIATPFQVEVETWYQVAVSWSKSLGLHLYVDGALVAGVVASSTSHYTPTSNNLCIGYGYTPLKELGSYQVWVAGISIFYTTRLDLVRAGIILTTENQVSPTTTTEAAVPTPELSICQSSMTDITFTKITGTELLTSLSTMMVHGDATLESSPEGTLLVLDGPGQYVDMQTTGVACLDDITTCGTSFNFRLTFKFIKIDMEQNYILSSGGNMNNFSGISLYYFHGSLNFWVKNGEEVDMSIYQVHMISDEWYTLDATWEKASGNTSIYLNGESLEAKRRMHYQVGEQTEKNSLLLGKSPGGNHASHMKLLLFRLWTDTYTGLVEKNCTQELKLPVVPTLVSTPSLTTATSEIITNTNLAFTTIHGNILVTNSLNMTVSGSPQLIQDHNITFLQLNGTKQWLEIPQHSLPCLTSASTCHSGFTFQIGIMIQMIKPDEKIILLSNGKDNNSTMSLYYESKELHLVVFRGKEKWEVTVPHTIHINQLNTYQISWSTTEGLELYENNVLLGLKQSPTSVSTSHTSTSDIRVGVTSATLLVSNIQTWTVSRQVLVQKGIMKYPTIPSPTESNNTTTAQVTVTPTYRSTPSSATTKMSSTPKHPIHHEFSFTQVIGEIIVTTDFNITKHGDITFKHQINETSVVITDNSQWLEIATNKLGCVSNPAFCQDGFTIAIKATLHNMTSFGRIYLLKSDDNGTSFFLYHEKDMLYGRVNVDGKLFAVSTIFSIQYGHTHTYQLEWSLIEGLQLVVDNKLLVETTISTTISKSTTAVTSIQFGEVMTHSSVLLEIHGMQIWNERREFSTMTPHLSTPSPTTATSEIITNTNLAFTAIHGNILVTNSLNMTVSGSPQLIQDHNITFLQLNGTKQWLEIPQHSLPCLTSASTCHSGFTFQIGIMIQMIKPDEKIILLSNGKDNNSTMSLYYESKELHLVVFRGKEKWELTVPHTIHINQLNTYQISWSMTEGLELYENNVLLGLKQSPTPVSTSHTSTSDIRIGVTSATLLVSNIQTWTVSRQVLVQKGIMKYPTIPSTTESNNTTTAQVTVTPTYRSTPSSATTKMSSTPKHPIHHEFSFTQVIGEIIVTTDFNITKHGDITFKHQINETSIVITDNSQWLEIATNKLGCVSNPAFCLEGFTIAIKATLHNMTSLGRIYLLKSDDNGASFFLYHEKDMLYGRVNVDGKLFAVSTIFSIQYGHTHTYQLEWSLIEGLQLVVDNKLLVETTISTTISKSTTAVTSIQFGEVMTHSSVLLEIHGMQIWNERREFSTMTPHLSTPSPTTATSEIITNTNLAFTEIHGNILVTNSLNMTVSGSPQLIQDHNITFLQLNGTKQWLEIPQHSLPCLTSASTCHSGFTFQIGIMIQMIKPDEKIILLSNGKDNNSTMSLYYESKELHLVVFRGKEKWEVTVPHTIHINQLNTYQISWSMTEGLELYENNVLLGLKQSPTSVSTSHTSTSDIRVGVSSATLLVSNIQTWTVSRQVLVQGGILQTPTEPCQGTHVDPDKRIIDLSVQAIDKNILTTKDMNILAHGGPTVVEANNETSLNLSQPGQYLELETQCIPCLSDLTQCARGFTIQLQVILKGILESKTYIIDTSPSQMGYTSVSLFYQGEHIKGNVIVDKRRWMLNIPFEMKLDSQYLLQLSWSNSSGLHLYIDEYCVQTLPNPTGPSEALKIPSSFLIGKAATSNDTSAMVISHLKIYLATREELVESGILQAPVTTVPTTTLTPPTPPAVPEFIWNFVNIKNDTVMSSFLTLTLHGQPKGSNTGVVLNTFKDYLEIPNLGKTCLTDIRLCRNGLTIKIEVLFNKLEENTVILTTGAETPDLPGISILYRYAHFHVIFSSIKEAWFVSIPREQISTGSPHTLMVSWHQSLKVYVDQVLRATAQEHVSHPDTTHELKEQLYIGHSFTALTSVRPVNCVLKTFHIWYKFVDELQKSGAVTIKEEVTTPKADVCPAGCIPTTTTPKPTTPTTTQTPKPTSSTTESTTPEPTTRPDLGVPTFHSLLSLKPVVDQTGTYLACTVDNYSEKNVHIEFKWFIDNVEQIVKFVNTPLTEGRLYVSEIKDVKDNLFNKTIFCTARAKFTRGIEWSSTKQSVKFVPQITMLTATREKIVLIEGHQGTTIDLKTNCPPSLFCKVNHKGQCVVEIVATLQTNGRIHDRKCTQQVLLPQMVVQKSGSAATVCGQVMTSSNWKQTITIPIKATVDGLQDRDQSRNLLIQLRATGGVEKETLTQNIQLYQVLVEDKDIFRATTCSSLNDPHISTFDGLHYNNFQEGEYVLYRHKTLPYEVRAQYRRCSTNHRSGPTCNCAVAIQAGDDVITISGCHGTSGRRSIFSRFIHSHSPPLTVDMYKNGELTPGTTVRRIGCGQTYEIRMPTGTTVTVKTSFKSFINVWVRASAVDFKQSLGLCGSFNGDKTDDLYGFDQKLYGYTRQPDQFCKTWHVPERSTIFHGVSANTVSTDTYCSCIQGRQLYCGPSLDIFRCTATTARDDITATLVRQTKPPGPSLRRSKRDVTFGTEQVTFDQSDEEEPVGNYTMTTADQYCQDYMDRQTATKTCGEFANATKDLLRDCAEDLVQTGDVEWAQSHLDDIITKCISEAVRTAPFTNTTLTESLPHDVMSSLCAQDCHHGTCQEASCVCQDGYTGISCDVSKVTKPEIVPVNEDESGCNINNGCAEVTIMGVNFVESDSLKCFYQVVDVTSRIETLGPWIPTPATYLSTYQVVCTLPPHSARVGVSNDGVQRSDNSYLHVVHGDCHTCVINEDGSDAHCDRQADTCVISDTCYQSGDTKEGSECQACEPTVSQDTWTLDTDPLCSATKLSQTDASQDSVSTLTILLAVFVAVLAMVIVVGVIVYCKKRTPNQTRKKLVEEGEYNFSSPQSRLSSMPRPNMRDISFSNNVYDGTADSLQPEMRETH